MRVATVTITAANYPAFISIHATHAGGDRRRGAYGR